MSPGEILRVATKAVRFAVRKSRMSHWPQEQVDEARQIACLAILEAERTKPEAHEGYYFMAAVNRIATFQLRTIRQHGRYDQLSVVDVSMRCAPDTDITEHLIRMLPWIEYKLQASRRIRNRNTLVHVHREVVFLKLILQGFDYAELSRSMELSVTALHKLRVRLLVRLRELAAEASSRRNVSNATDAS